MPAALNRRLGPHRGLGRDAFVVMVRLRRGGGDSGRRQGWVGGLPDHEGGGVPGGGVPGGGGGGA